MKKLAKCEVMEMSSKMQGDGNNLQNTRRLTQYYNTRQWRKKNLMETNEMQEKENPKGEPLNP